MHLEYTNMTIISILLSVQISATFGVSYNEVSRSVEPQWKLTLLHLVNALLANKTFNRVPTLLQAGSVTSRFPMSMFHELILPPSATHPVSSLYHL